MKRARLASAEALSGLDDLVPPWPARTTRVDGALVHYRATPARSPDAEPALYVHGLGGTSLNWTDLAYLLADRLDGHAVDLPGFGRSDPPRRYSLAAVAERLARFVEVADRGPVHLLGNSLGGAIAVQLAGCRPDLVRTLTLISPAMPFLDPRRSVQGRLVPLLLIPRVERLAARHLAGLDPADMARMVIASCFADPGRYPEQRLAEAVEEGRLRFNFPGYTGAYVRTFRSLVGSFLRAYLPGSGSLWRVAGRITAPTLVLAGRNDQLVDIRVAPQVARAIPDSRLAIVDGVGHVAQMEVPHLVARAVLGLLDEAAPRRVPA
jgi:pimeloyl-ACP methyl ester carboxylesterase